MPPRYQILISNEQRVVKMPARALKTAAETVLRDEQVAQAEISVALVGNARIHEVNRQFLKHDYPTDVISFLLESEQLEPLEEPPAKVAGKSTGLKRLSGQPARPPATVRRGRGLRLEGEIVIGAEYAAELADQYDWTATEEITLYLVHGLLHLCGYDDLTPSEKRIIRRREKEILEQLNITASYQSRNNKRRPE